MEDGIGTGNEVIRNLGIRTECHAILTCVSTNLGIPSDPDGFEGQQSEDVLLPSDNTVATFWITNPSNDYVEVVYQGRSEVVFDNLIPESREDAREILRV